MEHKYAATNGKKTLYKFRYFREAKHKGWVRETIVEQKIYFSRRSQINDPFDLAPILRLDGAYDDPGLRRRLMERLKATLKRNKPDHSTEELNAVLAWFSVCDLSTFEENSRQNVLERLGEHYWVFSLAGNREHPMLWSHYADGHSGLCLHFLSDEPSIFGKAQEVRYRKERPVVSFPFDEDDDRDLLEKSTLWKGVFWHYEDEYRLVRYPHQDPTLADFGLHLDGQHAVYRNPNWLTGITVGACMGDKEVAEVLELAANHRPKLPVWKARTTLTYDLEFDQIA